jgi:hypothetical protein
VEGIGRWWKISPFATIAKRILRCRDSETNLVVGAAGRQPAWMKRTHPTEKKTRIMSAPVLKYRFWPVTLAALLVAACGSNSDPGQTTAAEMLDPTQPHYGKTYSDWGVAWWQWFFAQPGTTHPISDATGERCTEGQDPASPVFFLVGTGGGKVNRSQCQFSSKQAVLFPILNDDLDNAGGDPAMASTVDQLVTSGNTWFKTVDLPSLSANVDGQSLSGLERGAAGPTQFSYDVPADDNIYQASGLTGVSGTIDPAVTVGYWVLLAPMSAGAHEIHFSGTNEDPINGNMIVDVTYELMLQ